MSENASPIDEKKNEQSGGTKKEANWMGFLRATIVNMIIVMIWAILGSNLIYFLHGNLDAWFPDNRNMPPYSEPTVVSSMMDKLKGKVKEYKNKMYRNKSDIDPTIKGGFSEQAFQTGGLYNKENDKCFADYKNKDITRGVVFLREKLGMDKLSAPYSGITNDPGPKALFSNFFGSSARYSYIMGRRLIKLIYKLIRSGGGASETALFLLVPSFLIMIAFQVPFFFGFFTTLWGEITSSYFGWYWTWVFFFIFGISLIWPILVGLTQMVQFVITFLILPTLVDFNMIKEIISCNLFLLNGLFSSLTIISSFVYLDVLYASIISISLIIMTIMRK